MARPSCCRYCLHPPSPAPAMPMCGISALGVEVAFAAPFRMDERASDSKAARGHGGAESGRHRGQPQPAHANSCDQHRLALDNRELNALGRYAERVQQLQLALTTG
mmetsp:Transcript_27941/g.47278  ORF Transcript_27941/g.47278 Transcript_27941/m.47278 type:complete len:106 (-) Transcript_27941:787-1104(-)